MGKLKINMVTSFRWSKGLKMMAEILDALSMVVFKIDAA